MSVRVEPFTVGNFVHVYNRGNKKEPIFFDKSDYWQFLWSLRFFNDERDITKFARSLTELVAFQKEILRGLEPRDYHDGRNTFEWRQSWGEQRPLIEIISYDLSPNHFHLLLREIIPGGISKFMKKLGIGYTMYRNVKSGEVGRVFQGQYKGKTVTDESYLQYLDVYVQVFNPFELFEGGILAALNDFDKAFQFALDYPFCSLGEVYGSRNLHIVNRDCFKNVFSNLQIYEEFCKDALITRNTRELLGKLTME
jgi:putative transposase